MMRTWMLWRTSGNNWVSYDNTDDGIGDPRRVVDEEEALDLVAGLYSTDPGPAGKAVEAWLREHGRLT